ncbi:hypothetical protein Scep_024360 [Stephania cephalantha]|uniref:Uncharacterized protein n=1 Tax=Stephania cephalantha TaxID=152367 RepID=A0AAP0EWE8_9MAGN
MFRQSIRRKRSISLWSEKRGRVAHAKERERRGKCLSTVVDDDDGAVDGSDDGHDGGGKWKSWSTVRFEFLAIDSTSDDGITNGVAPFSCENQEVRELESGLGICALKYNKIICCHKSVTDFTRHTFPANMMNIEIRVSEALTDLLQISNRHDSVADRLATYYSDRHNLSLICRKKKNNQTPKPIILVPSLRKPPPPNPSPPLASSSLALSPPPSPSSPTLIIVVLRDSAASLLPLHRPLLARRRHRPEHCTAVSLSHPRLHRARLFHDSAAGLLISRLTSLVSSSATPRRWSPHPRLAPPLLIRDSPVLALVRDSAVARLIRDSAAVSSSADLAMVSSSATPSPLVIHDSAGASLIRDSVAVSRLRLRRLSHSPS